MPFRVYVDEIRCDGSYLEKENGSRRVICQMVNVLDQEKPLYGGVGELEFTPIGDQVASFRLINLPRGWEVHPRGVLCPGCAQRKNEEGFHIKWVE